MTPFEIKTDLFAALGCLMAGERSDLSPMPMHAPEQVSPEQHQRLLQSGLLGADGAPASGLSPLLEVLKTAQSSASLLFMVQDGQKEYQIYYPPDGYSPVVLMMDQDRTLINSAGESEAEIIANLQRLAIPVSPVATPFPCRLSMLEADALAVLIDLNRRASSRFSAQADLSALAVPALIYTASQIHHESCKREGTSSDRWLFSTLFDMLVLGDEWSLPQFEQALRGLVPTGLVESYEQGYLLNSQVATYTNSFTMPQGGLILNASYQPVDALVRTERLATFTAGEETLVLLSTSDKFLLVNPIPPARVVEIARQALRKPMLLGEAAGVAPTTRPSCPVCYEPYDPGETICQFCGASLGVPSNDRTIEVGKDLVSGIETIPVVGAEFESSKGWKTQPQSRRKGWLLVGILLLILSCLVTACGVSLILFPNLMISL